MKTLKDLSWKIKNELEKKGHKIPITQLLDSISKSLDYRSYEHCKVAPEAEVEKKIKVYKASSPVSEETVVMRVHNNTGKDEENLFQYDVTIEALAVIQQDLRIVAPSPQEARKRAYEYYENNENFCRDYSIDWSLENRSSNCVVTKLNDSNLENELDVTPDWSFDLTIPENIKKKADKEFNEEVKGFNS